MKKETFPALKTHLYLKSKLGAQESIPRNKFQGIDSTSLYTVVPAHHAAQAGGIDPWDPYKFTNSGSELIKESVAGKSM